MRRLVVWGPLTGDAIQRSLLETEGAAILRRGELPHDDGRRGEPICLTTPGTSCVVATRMLKTGDAP